MWPWIRRSCCGLVVLVAFAGCDARGQQAQAPQGTARVEEIVLTDGTRCVTYASSITCDWTSKGWTSTNTGAQP